MNTIFLYWFARLCVEKTEWKLLFTLMCFSSLSRQNLTSIIVPNNNLKIITGPFIGFRLFIYQRYRSLVYNCELWMTESNKSKIFCSRFSVNFQMWVFNVLVLEWSIEIVTIFLKFMTLIDCEILILPLQKLGASRYLHDSTYWIYFWKLYPVQLENCRKILSIHGQSNGN